MSWQNLENKNPQSLAEARVQLHYAVQPAAAVGIFLLEERPDWSHGALSYDPGAGAFFGQPLPGDLRAGLDVVGLKLVLEKSGQRIAEKDLAGSTYNQGLDWMQSQLRDQGVEGKLKRPEYPDFPDHALAGEARFQAGLETDLKELSRYLENSLALLNDLAAANAGASPVRVWPHHFDIATLISVREPSKPGGEDGVSIGVGLSPGDRSSAAPYYYVTPWPYPGPNQLPELGFGRWNTDGWVGALLEAGDIVGQMNQKEAAQGFLTDAVAACTKLLAV